VLLMASQEPSALHANSHQQPLSALSGSGGPTNTQPLTWRCTSAAWRTSLMLSNCRRSCSRFSALVSRH